MMQESRNPMALGNNSGNFYDLLKSLAEEITEGIFNLSGPEVNKNDLRSDVESIAELAAKEKSPEVMVNVLLFRKYADIANNVKDTKNEKFSFMGDLPSLVEENPHVELVGWSALGTKIFWLRLSCCLLAFISFVVMSTVPGIQYADYSPSHYFLYPGCKYFYVKGTFNFKPFQAVLTVGVMIFFYNALFAVYYVLPTDVNKRKFIPGLASLLSSCMSKDRADDVVLSGAACLKRFSRLSEMLLDGALLILGTFFCVISSIMLERSSKFTYNYRSSTGIESIYFSIGSFFSTFAHQSPLCIESSRDPGPKIRASLAMLYLTLFFLTLCFIVSYNQVSKQFKGASFRSVIMGGTGGSNGMSGGDKGTPVSDEEVVEFRSLPDHSEHDEGGRAAAEGHVDRSMSV